MDPTTATAWVNLVERLWLGLTVAALIFIWGLATRKIVWGWQYEAQEKKAEAWQSVVDEFKDLLRKLVEREEQRV